MLMNQREFTRVTVAIHVELRVGGNVIIHGNLENVSCNGLLLRCDATLPEQTPCLVVLYLHGGQGGPSIKAQGLVVRHEPPAIAVQFIEIIGHESAQHLRNLVLYNSGGRADHVEKEFESHVGLRAKS
jgi:hypothetical protein